MSESIVVADEHTRPSTDLTVKQAAQNHADPDEIAEILAPTQDSAAAGESADRTLAEFTTDD